MKKLSLLSAALAVSAFAALPALAQGTPPVSTGANVQMQSGDTGAKTDVKTNAKTDVKADAKSDLKGHASTVKKTEQKPQQQVAQHPDSAAKTDMSTKTDSK
ncbi:MAG TPA: hypothetical protein VLV50_10465 [Stellaceae bacterium]|nr:hypothetical protein [Stellaceae bacterium]